MKITKSQLKRIIKEELNKSLKEIHGMASGEEYTSALGAAPPLDAGAAFDEYSPEAEESRAVDEVMSEFAREFEKMRVDPTEVEKALRTVDAAAIYGDAVDEVSREHRGMNLRDRRTPRQKIAEKIVAALGLDFMPFKKK